MHTAKHIVIIAGEESGDAHAAALIKQLKARHSDLKITGIGGKHMLDAGAILISDLARYGVTGITEVIRHLNVIRKAFRAMQQHLREHQPDLLILVDYPGFNLRMAKFAKKELGIKVIYYISPQIWAWKAKRIHTIKECVDEMAVILPFEKSIYEDAKVPVRFVGHPLVEKINAVGTKQEQRQRLKLSEQEQIIALLPGSRRNEIERHMPVLRDTAEQLHQHYPDIRFIIPIAGTVNQDKVANYFAQSQVPVTFVPGQALSCMAAADFVVVASGTASLECALLQKPMCIIYKCSFLTYLLATKLVKVKFIGLCNLLVNRLIVPEFLQYDCSPKQLSQFIIQFLNDPQQSKKMLSELCTLHRSMSSEKSDCTLLGLIESHLPEKNA